MKKIILLFIVLISIKSNAQWMQISTIPTTQLNAVKFFDVNTGIAVGANGIWRSTNSGVNWIQTLISGNMNGLCFYDINSGYAVGDTGKIYRTINNGQNWTQQAAGLVNNNLYGVAFSLSLTWHIVGSGSIILRTFNASTWDYITWGNDDYYSVIMNSSGTGFAIGGANHEVVLATANGGTNWLTVMYQNGNHCYNGTFLNSAANILLVGNDGRIRKSVDNGAHWTFPVSNSGNSLRSVNFPIANTGYIVGDVGTILKTTDNGLTWVFHQTGVTNNNLRGVSFINVLTGWTVGDIGIVLRTGIPVSIPPQTELVKSFTLHQNFPNPFNPSTKLLFDLEKEDVVNIKIYDSSGKIIYSLANNRFTGGKHELEWTASDLPSGIYFATLSNNKNYQTIKMILIK